MVMTKVDDYAISEEAFNLRNALDKILETLVSVYASYGVPLPSRRYWTFGPPAIDCEQAVVSFVQLYLGLPGDEASQPRPCSDPRSMVVNINIAREIMVITKTGKLPSGAQIQAGSEWQAIDAWVLMEAMQQFDTWGAAYGGRGLGVIATVDTGAAEGGFASVNMTLTVAVG